MRVMLITAQINAYLCPGFIAWKCHEKLSSQPSPLNHMLCVYLLPRTYKRSLQAEVPTKLVYHTGDIGTMFGMVYIAAGDHEICIGRYFSIRPGVL